MTSILKKIENHKKTVFGIIAIIIIALFAFSITPKQMQNDIFYTVK